MSDAKDEEPRSYASPPCLMHEVDPVYMGLAPAGEPSTTEATGRECRTERKAPTAEASFCEVDLRRIAETVIHDIPDAVICADKDGVIRFWNGGAARIFGFSAEEAVGRSLDIIIPERLRQRHWDGYRRMIATGRSQHGPTELLSVPAQTKSGDTRSIQFTIACVHGENGGEISGVVALLRDVTAAYRELKQLRSLAAQA